MNYIPAEIGKLIDLANEFLSEIVVPAVGPTIKEIGGYVGDNVRYFRFQNQVNILVKAQEKLKQSGISPGKVPSKLLVPLLENGSLEDEESMVDKWANLLANAANPNYPSTVEASFIEILKQLSPNEVLILDKYYDNYSSEKGWIEVQNEQQQKKIKGSQLQQIIGLQTNDFEDAMNNLSRFGLLGSRGISFGPNQYGGPESEIVMTRFGYMLVSACRA